MKKHIVFVITEDWVFVSHRLHLAKFALKTGMKVTIVCNISLHGKLLKNCGFNLVNWQIERGSKNIFGFVLNSLELSKILSRINPDVLHIVALKPILLSGLFSYFNPNVKKIFCITGLGFIFTSKRYMARMLSFPVSFLLSKILNLKTSLTVVQNNDDKKFVIQNLRVLKENVRLIKGAGVDTKKFKRQSEKKGQIVVALPARLLVDKGVYEFVELAKNINASGRKATFRLIGDIDSQNPNSVSRKDLDNWVSSRVIEWTGLKTNMVKALSEVHVICFPSYREGLPKALLEAFACGKPVVAFDVPGCREVVLDKQNGFLVPFKNIDAMSACLLELISDQTLRKNYGDAGHKIVNLLHSEEVIQSQFNSLWR